MEESIPDIREVRRQDTQPHYAEVSRIGELVYNPPLLADATY